MPTGFLTSEQEASYGRYNGEPTAAQLARYFHLDDADRQLIGQRRGERSRLGFALQLTTVRFLGTFLSDPTDVPAGVVAYLAAQLRVHDPSCISRYDNSSNRWEHVREIKERYGYRDFGEPAEVFRLARWLYTRAWLSTEGLSVLFDLATARLVERRVLLPGVTVLERLVARARERATARTWRILSSAPSTRQKKSLLSLLTMPESGRQSHLDRLRKGPDHVSGPALVEALLRLRQIRDLGVSRVDVSRVPPARVRALARYAAAAWAQTIERMPEDRRIATLLAFAKTYEVTAMDDALDVLDLLISDILKRPQTNIAAIKGKIPPSRPT